MILRELAGGHSAGCGHVGQRRAAIASVCSEWQAFFERRSFRKLVLHVSDLAKFEKMVKRRTNSRNAVQSRSRANRASEGSTLKVARMPQIKHIWLRNELNRYDCPKCRDPEGGREPVRYTHTKALLCGILLTCVGTTYYLRKPFVDYWAFSQHGRKWTTITGSS